MKTILTVDVGGTKILIGEVDFSGMILSKIKRPSDISTQKAAMNQIIDVIKSYIRSNTIGDIQAIAIDTVGRVNNDDGIWYEIDYKNKEKIDVSALIRKQFGFPCYVINDLAAATFAEKRLELGQ